MTIPRGQYDALAASMNLPTTLVAPLPADEPIGSVVVRLGDDTLAERSLYSLTPVASGNFIRRAVDEVRLWFE